VLVEKEAGRGDLDMQPAQVASWEHGFTRSKTTGQGLSAGRTRVFVARSEADAPDIDGRVYVRGTVPVGEFVQVEVVGHTDYDLIARPVARLEPAGPAGLEP
jgi:ribosomal protein S12 methylthiotransferase